MKTIAAIALIGTSLAVPLTGSGLISANDWDSFGDYVEAEHNIDWDENMDRTLGGDFDALRQECIIGELSKGLTA